MSHLFWKSVLSFKTGVKTRHKMWAHWSSTLAMRPLEKVQRTHFGCYPVTNKHFWHSNFLSRSYGLTLFPSPANLLKHSTWKKVFELDEIGHLEQKSVQLRVRLNLAPRRAPRSAPPSPRGPRRRAAPRRPSQVCILETIQKKLMGESKVMSFWPLLWCFDPCEPLGMQKVFLQNILRVHNYI